MPLQTASMSVLGKDWLRPPTSVSVAPSFSAAHGDFVSMSRHAHDQLTRELPVAITTVTIITSKTVIITHDDNKNKR